MKSHLRWLIVPAVLVGVGYFLRAQDLSETRKTGKVLVLKSGLTMEGDITQIGSQVCVKNGKSEVWIAVDKTMRLSPDWFDAYAFMQTLIKKDNPSDRIKLARWCHLNRLYEEAVEQARCALELQPGHADARQMVTMLEREKKEAGVRPMVKAAPPQPVRAFEPPPTVDVTQETLIAFTAKVQPILMNTCASCHAGDASGKFHLERVSESSHKVATQRNLAAVLNYVDLDRPTISPLLVKSITPHGREALPAIRDRSAKPFQAMQEWINETIKKNPQLKDYRDATKPTPARVAPPPTPEPKSSAFSSQGAVLPKTEVEVVSRKVPRLEVPAAQPTPAPQAAAPQAAAPPRERDWCDAGHFNDYFHPKR